MDYTKNLEEVYKHLFDEGGFLTVKSGDIVNSMTISWGSIGQFWNKLVFMVLVRPTRYTYNLLEAEDNFTVSVPFGSKMSEALKICGTKSGRDTDKEKLAGLKYIPSRVVETPVVGNCDMHYECKIVYKHAEDPSLILAPEIEELYNNDYHMIYFGEIVACYEEESQV